MVDPRRVPGLVRRLMRWVVPPGERDVVDAELLEDFVGRVALLISPAALFMTSLLLRKVGALQSEPARTAQQIVSWYSERMWTLWGLLIALPLVVLGVGCTTLLRSWHEDPDLRRAIREPGAAMDTQLATVGIAVVSLAAGGVLVVVVGHMLAN